ncbi:MAG: hypothetical protein KatS3mg111_2857 [Pirellulaceae bacterium]|nr:MAG: hypothetical protein KatS3mg111_2857 [Pirellulaceae bacterium]
MADSENHETKIVVDENWKERVEREKREAAERVSPGTEADSSASPREETHQAAADAYTQLGSQEAKEKAQSGSRQPLPPVSFELLVTSLATQAMFALGLLPGPDGQTAPADREMARHYIDLLDMLEQKTRGNLTGDESKLLSDTLYQLRMTYVALAKQANR